MFKISISILCLITICLTTILKKHSNGNYYFPGKSCGISTPIRYLNILPENFDGIECTFVIESKVKKSADGSKFYKSKKTRKYHCNLISVPFDCEMDFIYYKGDQSNFGVVKDAPNCAKSCQKDPDCEFFFFDTTDQRCYFVKNLKEGPVRSYGTLFIGGFSNCSLEHLS